MINSSEGACLRLVTIGFRKIPISILCPVMRLMDMNVSFGPLEYNNLVKALVNPESGLGGALSTPLYPLAIEFR